MMSLYEIELFKIRNREIDQLEALLQSIALLLRIDSPFQEKKVSFEEFKRYNDIDAIRAEAPIRIKNIEYILKPDYELTSLCVADIEQESEDGVRIWIDVKTPYTAIRASVLV